MLKNSDQYKRTRKDHVLNNEAIKLKKEYCENCFVQFKIVNLKFSHNCKRCFRTVCHSCGAQREKIIGCLEKPEQNHRICNMCKEERNQIEYFIQKHNLRWGQSSQICDRWLESLGLLQQKKELNQEYQVLADQIKKNWNEFELKTPELAQVKKDLKDFHACAIKYNYSFCEVLFCLQGDMSNEIISQEIYNIMVRFLFKFPEVGYTREYLKILTFLMCFCTQQEAYFIFTNIIYYVIPPPLYPKEAKKNKMETVEKYLQYIIDDIVDQKGFGEENILLVKQFLSGSYFLYYQSFFINYLQFQVCFAMIDNIIMKRDFKELEKYIKAVSFKHIVNMRQVGSNTDQLNEVILRWTTKISDLDQIIAKNFKNITHQYHLDLIDKNEHNLQKKQSNKDQSKTIDELKGDLETMNQYSKAVYDDLQKKIQEFDTLKAEQDVTRKEYENLKRELENLKKEPKKTQFDEQQFNQLKSQFEKKLKELENDNKNLKIEVFENNMQAMKMNKSREDELMALNKKLQEALENLKQEQMKVKSLQSELDQMKKTFSENEKKYVEIINQERMKVNNLTSQCTNLTNQCKMMQQKLQQQQQQTPQTQTFQSQSQFSSSPQSQVLQVPLSNGQESSRVGSSQTLQLPKNNLSIQTSPNNSSISTPRLPSSPNDSKQNSMTAIPPSPNGHSPTRSSSTSKADPLVLQVSQQQQQIQQQQSIMNQMRQKGQQISQQLMQAQKDLQQKDSQIKEMEQKLETFTKKIEQQQGLEKQCQMLMVVQRDAQQKDNFIRERDQKIQAQMKKIEELQEELEGKDKHFTSYENNCKITLDKFKQDFIEKDQKIADLAQKLQKAQQQVERLITQANTQEKNSEQLFEMQLGQKQASIEQKVHIIREKEEELNQTKIKNVEFQKQFKSLEKQIQVLQNEKAELQEKITNLQEEIQNKDQLLQKFQESISSQDFFNEKEKILIDREKQLSAKSQQLEKQKQDLVVKSEELKTQEEKLQQLESQLKEQQLQLLEKQEEISETQNKLKQQEAELKKKSNQILSGQESLVQKQVQLQEKENQLLQKESEIVKEKEEMNNQLTSITSQKKQLVIQEAALNKSKEDFKTKESNFSQKQKYLQDLQNKINEQQQELVKQKEILLEERRAVQSKLGELDTIGKSAVEEESLKRQKQVKDLGEFLQKMETKLKGVHQKMKEDCELISNQIGLNIDLVDDNFNNLQQQQEVQAN
ncbi:hypothetical protein TTHERM_00022770 (macronuclear) [Tetrahymena thermophila SB210]|uniref:FYVE-type domain-containing protein n=1 Tax=Tetrahymena thermophila (strain SB210) TaxID=312017 RepID=Q22RA5_TETTS|nr:hypothetical protein TTHERM_00022770 [Tetrahymena thermophila SB210]EAR88217.3 hypothetical protein TTHERM_00022770 [Tetrahymena thermophila SB210]|eukprot:XP_001008462.3 hypothetical protein TTHERM_00022770 [Tetrahymena thermophila SB210]